MEDTNSKTRTGQLIGYVRKSTGPQDTAYQYAALKEAGVDERLIYADSGSGKTTRKRPDLRRMIDALQPNDKVVIHRFDRLSREMADSVLLADEITAKGAGVRILTGPLAGDLDTKSTMGKIMIAVVSGLAQLEREAIEERTRASLDSRPPEQRGGRPKALSSDQEAAVLARRARGESIGTIAKALGVGKATVHRAVQSNASVADDPTPEPTPEPVADQPSQDTDPEPPSAAQNAYALLEQRGHLDTARTKAVHKGKNSGKFTSWLRKELKEAGWSDYAAKTVRSRELRELLNATRS